VNALVRVFVPASQLDSARLVLLETGLGAPEQPAEPPAPVPAHRLSGRLILLAITALVIIIFLIATMHGRVT